MAVESNQTKITDTIAAETGIAMDMTGVKKTEVPSAAPSISTAPTVNRTQSPITSHSPTNVYTPSALPTMSVTLSISTSTTLTVPPTSMPTNSPSFCPTTPDMKKLYIELSYKLDSFKHDWCLQAANLRVSTKSNIWLRNNKTKQKFHLDEHNQLCFRNKPLYCM